MKKYTIEIPVHFSDSDATGCMSPVSIMRAMIESSMRHSESVRTEDFRDIWVLYQWDVEFSYFPKPGTRLTATTWTTGFYKFYAYRNFLLKEGERVVAQAKTTWLLLAEQSKRPMRVPPSFARLYGSDLLPVQPADEKEVLPFEGTRNLEITVRSYEIDPNQHVNNLVYADWVLEAVPLSFRNNHALQRLVLTYRKQVLYPEEVRSVASNEQEVIHHRIEDAHHEIRAWARTYWA